VEVINPHSLAIKLRNQKFPYLDFYYPSTSIVLKAQITIVALTIMKAYMNKEKVQLAIYYTGILG